LKKGEKGNVMNDKKTSCAVYNGSGYSVYNGPTKVNYNIQAGLHEKRKNEEVEDEEEEAVS
jgi:hypothetical protein